MKLGKFQIDVVETGVFSLDGGSMFGVVPKSLWSKAYHPGDELNRIPLSARPMLVRWDDRIVLIDSGNGTKMSDKLAGIYGIDREISSLDFALKSFNVKPEDVTDVIFTHLHFDHSGGATKYIASKSVPVFPNANHYVQQEHLKWAQNPTEKDRASFLKDDYLPLLSDGLLKTIDGEGELFPGISVMPFFGHTHAMQTVKIYDEGQTLLFCADFCATSAHIPVPYVMGYDNQPLVAIEEKKKVLPQAYEEKWILCFEHDINVQAATISSNEKGFSIGEKKIITQLP